MAESLLSVVPVLAVLALAGLCMRLRGKLAAQVQSSQQREGDLRAALGRAEEAALAGSARHTSLRHAIQCHVQAVIGSSDLLLADDPGQDQFAHAQRIADSGRAMMRLLHDALHGARIEAGPMRLLEEPTDVRRQLRECVKLHEPLARAKNLALSAFVDDDVPQLLWLDSLRFRQVVLNLIDNAVKFTDDGGVDVEARMESSSHGRMLLIAVIDSGRGIEPDRLDSIFAPHSHPTAQDRLHFGEPGLGLAIASQLAEMMQGRITVQARPGIGSCFTLRLPSPAAHRQPALERSSPISATGLAGARVLVVQHRQGDRQVTMTTLAGLGVSARQVDDANQAISAVQAADQLGQPFDAVLMDLHLTGVDGLEATRRLRAMGFAAETLPIIALLPDGHEHHAAACRNAGMQSHLHATVTSIALARELARCLALRATSATSAAFAPQSGSSGRSPRP